MHGGPSPATVAGGVVDRTEQIASVGRQLDAKDRTDHNTLLVEAKVTEEIADLIFNAL